MTCPLHVHTLIWIQTCRLLPHFHVNAADLTHTRQQKRSAAFTHPHVLIANYSHSLVLGRSSLEKLAEEHAALFVFWLNLKMSFSACRKCRQLFYLSVLIFFVLFVVSYELRLMSVVIIIPLLHSKVAADFVCSTKQSASSSTCTLWVTVSMSTICRLVFRCLHCVVSLIAMFVVYVPVDVSAFLHVPPCVKTVTSWGVKRSML